MGRPGAPTPEWHAPDRLPRRHPHSCAPSLSRTQWGHLEETFNTPQKSLQTRKPAKEDVPSNGLEHAFAGMCSKKAARRDNKPSAFPLQIGFKTDARTRAGDPFITSYGPLSPPVTRSHLKSVPAPNPPD